MAVFVAFINVINKFGINNAHYPFDSGAINLSTTNFTEARTKREMGVSTGIASGNRPTFIKVKPFEVVYSFK